MLRDQVEDVRKREPGPAEAKNGRMPVLRPDDNRRSTGRMGGRKNRRTGNGVLQMPGSGGLRLQKKKEGTGHRSDPEAIWAIPENGDH